MTTEQATEAACPPVQNSPEHGFLKPFVGTFRAEIKIWMGPGDPHNSTGTMTNVLELGDRFLNQNYKGDANDGPFPNFEGRGFWGYNSTNKRFEGLWIDTAADFFQIEYGQVDKSGKKWEMKGEMTCPQTGDPFKKRSIITLVDNDHHTMEMFFTGTDGKEAKGMEIKYTRA